MDASCVLDRKPTPVFPENSTVEGIIICVKCGSIHTTIHPWRVGVIMVR